MIKNILRHRKLCRSIFIMAGLFVFLSTYTAHAECNGVDYSSAYNNHGGFYNALNYPNNYAFAALKSDGSITAWGSSSQGGLGAPTDFGYISIYPNAYAFAAQVEV